MNDQRTKSVRVPASAMRSWLFRPLWVSSLDATIEKWEKRGFVHQDTKPEQNRRGKTTHYLLTFRREVEAEKAKNQPGGDQEEKKRRGPVWLFVLLGSLVLCSLFVAGLPSEEPEQGEVIATEVVAEVTSTPEGPTEVVLPTSTFLPTSTPLPTATPGPEVDEEPGAEGGVIATEATAVDTATANLFEAVVGTSTAAAVVLPPDADRLGDALLGSDLVSRVDSVSVGDGFVYIEVCGVKSRGAAEDLLVLTRGVVGDVGEFTVIIDDGGLPVDYSFFGVEWMETEITFADSGCPEVEVQAATVIVLPTSTPLAARAVEAGPTALPRPANCKEVVDWGYTAVQAAGWSHLDRDNDGVACYGD